MGFTRFFNRKSKAKAKPSRGQSRCVFRIIHHTSGSVYPESKCWASQSPMRRKAKNHGAVEVCRPPSAMWSSSAFELDEMKANNHGDGRDTDLTELVAHNTEGVLERSRRVEDVKDAFRMVDKDGDGSISSLELLRVMIILVEPCSLHDCEAMITEFDSNGDGFISFEEFMAMMGVSERSISAQHHDGMLGVVLEEDLDGDGDTDLTELVAHNTESMDMRSRRVQDLQDAFRMFDKDGDGSISPWELLRVLIFLQKPCSLHDCEAMIKEFDSNGDGLIGFEEFMAMMDVSERSIWPAQHHDGMLGVVLEELDGDGDADLTELVAHNTESMDMRSRRVQDMQDAFRMLDKDGDGCISPSELLRVLIILLEPCTLHDCEAMITEFDSTGDGLIGFEEFMAMMGASVDMWVHQAVLQHERNMKERSVAVLQYERNMKEGSVLLCRRDIF